MSYMYKLKICHLSWLFVTRKNKLVERACKTQLANPLGVIKCNKVEKDSNQSL